MVRIGFKYEACAVSHRPLRSSHGFSVRSIVKRCLIGQYFYRQPPGQEFLRDDTRSLPAGIPLFFPPATTP